MGGNSRSQEFTLRTRIMSVIAILRLLSARHALRTIPNFDYFGDKNQTDTTHFSADLLASGTREDCVSGYHVDVARASYLCSQWWCSGVQPSSGDLQSSFGLAPPRKFDLQRAVPQNKTGSSRTEFNNAVGKENKRTVDKASFP